MRIIRYLKNCKVAVLLIVCPVSYTHLMPSPSTDSTPTTSPASSAPRASSAVANSRTPSSWSSPGWDSSVSYTHLDVYKRQPLAWIALFPPRVVRDLVAHHREHDVAQLPRHGRDGHAMGLALDVYKRQGRPWAPRSG